MQTDKNTQNTSGCRPCVPQIKVCGLTDIKEATGCVEIGAGAIGFVFYPKSPRHISEDKAKEIVLSLPEKVRKVGVFVNETFSSIMEKVNYCHLDAVQLHGQESPLLVDRLRKENLLVIKALFDGRKPALTDALTYKASAFLVECGKGTLPGGNALAWNWEKASGFGKKHPFILAGGLSPENVSRAVTATLPDAVDVSSGVESSPGRKDLDKVKSFIDAVFECAAKIQTGEKKMRRIF